MTRSTPLTPELEHAPDRAPRDSVQRQVVKVIADWPAEENVLELDPRLALSMRLCEASPDRYSSPSPQAPADMP